MKVVILKWIKCKLIDHIKLHGLPLFKLGNCTLQCRNPLCNISPCICLLISIIVCSSISDLLCYYPYQSPSNKVLPCSLYQTEVEIWIGLVWVGWVDYDQDICLHLWNGRMVVWPAALLCYAVALTVRIISNYPLRRVLFDCAQTTTTPIVVKQSYEIKSPP